LGKVLIVCRVLLGLPFLIFGLNGVFEFFPAPAPEDMPPRAQALLEALTATGFMHPLRAFAEFVAGACLVSGFAVPLGLVVLAPVLVHILGYHIWLDPDPGGRVFSSILMLLFLACSWAYRGRLAQLLKPRPG
jgi:putative oxidoreductase